jgi:hypothetical protein
MSDRLKAIWSGTQQWAAWLRHHRGTKAEARMLSCMAEVKPFHVPSEWPPEAPRADRLTVSPAAPTYTANIDRPSIAEGQLDEIAGRLEAKAERDEKEAEEKRRRSKNQSRADALRDAALNAAANNERPNVDDNDELDVIAVVDPHEEMEMEHLGRGSPMLHRKKNAPKQLRVVSLRDDPVGRMAKRGNLADNHEDRDLRLRAARYYESLYARAEIGGARGIAYREHIDGGRFETPDTDARLLAHRRLGELDGALGVDGVTIVRAVLVTKWELKTLARARGEANDRYLTFLGFRFRECLDCIATTAGIKQRPHRGHVPRDRFAAMDAPAAGSDALYTAIHRAKVTPR